MKNLTITSKDLNAIDKLNGSSSISNYHVDTKDMKGALSKYTQSLNFNDELLFINNTYNQLVEYKTEQYEYRNLPEGLDKYRVERKLIEMATIAIIKYIGKFYAVRYTISDFNMYDEPVEITVNEPKSKALNGLKFNIIDGDAVIIRDNIHLTPVYSKVYRLLKALERNLFQIEKNLTASAPKGIINLEDSEFDTSLNSVQKNTFELIINGEDTFYAIKRKENSDITDVNDKDLFIPIELTDRTETLWKNYIKLKEQVKEQIGASINETADRKEHGLDAEIANNQDLVNSSWKHAYNIRVNDWDKFNKKFSQNVEIILVDNTDQEVEDENTDLQQQ